MEEIKGHIYKFAGVKADILEKNGIFRLSAKFCGVNDDAENLPSYTLGQILAPDFNRSSPAACLGIEDMVHAFTVRNNLQSFLKADFNSSARDVLLDLGPEKLRRVLDHVIMMTPSDFENERFIPYTKMNPV